MRLLRFLIESTREYRTDSAWDLAEVASPVVGLSGGRALEVWDTSHGSLMLSLSLSFCRFQKALCKAVFLRSTEKLRRCFL